MSRRTVEFHSPTLSILECHCSGGDCSPSELRCTENTHIALTSAGGFVVDGGSRMVVAEGCRAVYNPSGTEYRVSHLRGASHSYTVLQPAEHLWDLIPRASPRAPDLVDVRYGMATVTAHVALRSHLANHACDRLALEESAMDVLASLTLPANGQARLRASRIRRAVLRAREELAGRVGENIGIEELASVAGCSPFHLARAFRSETGQSVRRYRLHLRLARALHLVAADHEDLALIATTCGFASQSHMSAAFQAVLGVTPSHSRRHFRQIKAQLKTKA